ncbi:MULTISPECIES: DUF6194 family protein [Microbacterium]|uniref:DUF6194 family protein n=1 Tax=Microbacterium TaxID=33882 RepID=UPI00301031AF
MTMQQILDAVHGFDGVLVVEPHAAPFPELAWGDAFFSYAPDGVMPERTQPYGTIITKDYPDDESSRLSAAGRFRVNIHVGGRRVAEVADPAADAADADVIVRHPVYGDAGWVSIVNPGTATTGTVLALLKEAHDAARARTRRRAERG